MRIAILGCGSIGRRHLADLLALGHRDLLVYDPDRLKAMQASGDYDAALADDMGQVGDWLPDCCIICTPPDSHMPLLYQAYEAGVRAAFIEKPLSNEQVGTGVEPPWPPGKCRWWETMITHVGCPLRWHEPLRQLRERFTAEPPQAAWFRCVYDPSINRPDWRQSYMGETGVLLDIGSHEVDLALWLLGPAKLKGADTEALQGLAVDRMAKLMLRHESGVMTDMSLAWAHLPYDHSARFYGPGTRLLDWTFDPAEHEQAYRRELVAFLAACRTGDTAGLNSVSEAAKVLGLLLQAREWAVA